MKSIKSYSEMLTYHNFEDRLRYLSIGGSVGEETFGSKRWVNQRFYTSKEWRNFRDSIIIRDNGCDMGLPDYPIFPNYKKGKKRGIIIHHIIPCRYDDFLNDPTILMDPENVVCVSYQTHRMIHYGLDTTITLPDVIDRFSNDTCPWKEANRG